MPLLLISLLIALPMVGVAWALGSATGDLPLPFALLERFSAELNR